VSLGALVFNKRLAHLHVSPCAHLCLVFDHGYSHARFPNLAKFAENQRIQPGLNFQNRVKFVQNPVKPLQFFKGSEFFNLALML
jgi:hypothetical protein